MHLVSILLILSTPVSQACDSELPHGEIIDTRTVETAYQAVGSKVIYRVHDFTIQVDPEYLLTALSRSGGPPSGLAVAARLKEEVSVATVTDASYVLELTYDFLKTTHDPGDDDNSNLDQALKDAKQELLSAFAQAMESEVAVVSIAQTTSELRKMIVTSYRGECANGKVFTSMSGDIILMVSEPAK